MEDEIIDVIAAQAGLFQRPAHRDRHVGRNEAGHLVLAVAEQREIQPRLGLAGRVFRQAPATGGHFIERSVAVFGRSQQVAAVIVAAGQQGHRAAIGEQGRGTRGEVEQVGDVLAAHHQHFLGLTLADHARCQAQVEQEAGALHLRIQWQRPTQAELLGQHVGHARVETSAQVRQDIAGVGHDRRGSRTDQHVHAIRRGIAAAQQALGGPDHQAELVLAVPRVEIAPPIDAPELPPGLAEVRYRSEHRIVVFVAASRKFTGDRCQFDLMHELLPPVPGSRPPPPCRTDRS